MFNGLFCDQLLLLVPFHWAHHTGPKHSDHCLLRDVALLHLLSSVRDNLQETINDNADEPKPAYAHNLDSNQILQMCSALKSWQKHAGGDNNVKAEWIAATFHRFTASIEQPLSKTKAGQRSRRKQFSELNSVVCYIKKKKGRKTKLTYILEGVASWHLIFNLFL